MKKFLVKLTLFSVILLSMDRGIFYFLQDHRPYDYKFFIDSKKLFFTKEQNIDLLIIGDSHVADALDTRIIDSAGNLRSFNLGIYHASPFENYYVTLAALKHLETPPKIVVLGTNPAMFNRSHSKGKYTPLIINDNYIKFQLSLNSIEGVDAGIVLKTLSEKYLFQHFFNSMIDKPYIATREVRSSYSGHLEFYNQSRNVQWSGYKKGKELHTNKIQLDYFVKTIELLLSHNVKVIILNPPIWYDKIDVMSKEENFIEFDNFLNSICLKYDLELYNPKHEFHRDELEKKSFLNPEHVNSYGAKVFSLDFVKMLNSKNDFKLQ
jgi:hypothetical protein